VVTNSLVSKAFTQSFQYDSLSRLYSAAEVQGSTTNWTQNYGYDNLGNRSMMYPGSWVPFSNVTPQASPAAQGSGWALGKTLTSEPFSNNRWTQANYDTNGNMTSNTAVTSAATTVYDAENRVQTVALPMNTLPMGYLRYYYGGGGRRVMKAVCTSTNPCTAGAGDAKVTMFVYDAAGDLAAEYSAAPPVVPGTTYVFADHLGSTRMLLSSAGAAVRCYDYAPFGEELSGLSPRSGVGCYQDVTYPSATDGATRAKFTGKERDSETGLDYFGARYYQGAAGRFSSPDGPFRDWDPADPQSWNLYGYVRNNPVRYTDPTGQACVVDDKGNESDDTNLPGPSCADSHASENNNKPSVTVTGKAPAVRDLAAEAEAERVRLQYAAYVRNRQRGEDLPLSPKSQQYIIAIANAAPTVCGGGVYVYGGREREGPGASVFYGGIAELDSRQGVSTGGLIEAGVGEGVVGGAGKIVTTDSQGQLAESNLIYGGAGVKTPVGGASAGAVGFTSGAGVYAEGFLFGWGGGAGAYANITTNADCNSKGHP